MQLTDPKHQSGVRMSKLPDFPFFQLLTFRFSGKILTPGLIRTRDDSLSLFVYVARSGSGTFPPQDQLPRVKITNYLFMHLIILKSPSTGQYMRNLALCMYSQCQITLFVQLFSAQNASLVHNHSICG